MRHLQLIPNRDQVCKIEGTDQELRVVPKMVRVSRVLPHLTEAEVKEKIRTANNFRRQQKWWIVYNALVEPRTAAEIARHTGTSVRDVHQVINLSSG